MGKDHHYGKEYIIPSTFDPRLISVVAPAVAKAAMDSGVARKPIEDFDKYENQLAARLDQSMNFMKTINTTIKGKKKRVVFAEGEDL